ncbi:MAG: hypothetical protein K2Q15_02325 [Burkholderiales bacterium]|nr:hypothetical protein [Burkholderiales bacterium]
MKAIVGSLVVAVSILSGCGGEDSASSNISTPIPFSPTLAPVVVPTPTPATISKALPPVTGLLVFNLGVLYAYGQTSGILPNKMDGCSDIGYMDKRPDDVLIGIPGNGNPEIYEFDPFNNKCKVIGMMPKGMNAFTVANDGTIYGYNSGLWHLNSDGSTISYIPLTGEIDRVNGLEYANGKLIGVSAANNAVVEIDPKSGVSKLVKRINDLPSNDIDIDEDGVLRGNYLANNVITAIRLSDGVVIESIKATSPYSAIAYKK